MAATRKRGNFDWNRCVHDIYGTEKFAAEMLEKFLKLCPPHMDALAKAHKEKDNATTRRLAHSLKGMGGYCCADDLVSKAFALQLAFDNKELDKVDDLYEDLRLEADAVITAVRALLKEKNF